jgi:serine/threonine protein kinase
MDSIYSIVHITTEKNYKKIMEDGYLRPYRSVHGTKVFCFIQKKKDQWKKIVNFRWFGKFAVELDKKILLERNDYIIRNSDSLSPTWEVFGGPVIYNAKNGKDKKKFNKAIHKMTNLNEIMFENKISLKKYMISAVTKKIPQVNKLQSGGVWGKNEADTFSVWKPPRDIETSLGLVKFNEPPIGRSSNAKIFMGILQGRGPNKNLDIAVKLQKNNIDAVNEGDISMELSGLTGIPKYFTHGVCGPEEKLYYIVMERLGQTFGSYDKIIGPTFGNNERHNLKMLVGNYSIQLINGIESLYMRHYYHFDITTSNILFGVEQNSNILYLIDFCNIAQTKKEYETDINNFNKNCNNYLYYALEDIIINYGINEYKKFFEYSIPIIKSTIAFIIKSILSNDTEPPKFQALRNMFSTFAKDLILPLRPDNNIFQLAIEHKIINDKIIPFLLQEI